MLTHIHIRDYTIIHRLELELSAGMSAVTGETGAGKSILVDALGYVLGDRADTGVIRHGCASAEVSASFDLRGLSAARGYLEEQGVDEADECIVRRVLTAEGRSRGYINGRPVPIQTLQQLGEHLVDIHGQHAHQSLLRRDFQRELLDEYGGQRPLAAQVAAAYQRWKELKDHCEQLQTQSADRDARLDLLRHHVQELDALNLQPGEMAGLEEEHKRLGHASRLLETCETALHALHDSDEASVLGTLGHTVQALRPLLAYDAHLDAPLKLLDDAGIQLREAVADLRHYVSGLDLDPARLQTLEQRLATLHDAARKYRVPAEELAALCARFQEELTALDGGALSVERLQAELKAAEREYTRLANTLSAGRREVATRLAAAVTAHMQELGIPGGQFNISVEPRAAAQYTATGLDQIEFQVSANPGQPLRPLTKVASGGELSRISLAIQVVTAQGTGVPTLVYDEVDVGIGGRVAEIVGQQLRALGARRQVLCVTHLPQVASQSHHHLLVTKSSEEGQTHTHIETLAGKTREEEIARMLGGVEITAQTRKHAREMITRAQSQPVG